VIGDSDQEMDRLDAEITARLADGHLAAERVTAGTGQEGNGQ
jgi:hypothetical protein